MASVREGRQGIEGRAQSLHDTDGGYLSLAEKTIPPLGWSVGGWSGRVWVEVAASTRLPKKNKDALIISFRLIIFLYYTRGSNIIKANNLNWKKKSLTIIMINQPLYVTEFR